MKLSDGMRIKQWMDTDKASYIKEVVAIWAKKVVLLEAVAEAARVYLDKEGSLTEGWYMDFREGLTSALAALDAAR